MSSCVLFNFYILTMIYYWHQIELKSRVNFIILLYENIFRTFLFVCLIYQVHTFLLKILFISLQCNCFTARLPLLVIVEKSFFVPFDYLLTPARMLLHAWKTAAEKPGCGVCIAQQSQGNDHDPGRQLNE